MGRQGGGEGAGSSRERASEGKRRGGQHSPARALPRPFLSHKRRQRAHQPCPALRPPRCRRRAPRPRRPPPRPPGSLYFGEGRGGGDAGPGGLEGPNIAGCFGFAPLFPKSKSRNADRGAVRLRPGLTSPAPSAGSSDVRFPVRLVPDPVASRRHWLGQRRATSGTPSPGRAPAACGSPSGVSAGLCGERASREQPRRAPARPAPPRSGSFHHALAARLLSGVFPAGRRAAPGSARGARRRRCLRVGTRLLLGRGAGRGRGQGGCGLHVPGWAVGGSRGSGRRGPRTSLSSVCSGVTLCTLDTKFLSGVHAFWEITFLSLSLYFHGKLLLNRKVSCGNEGPVEVASDRDHVTYLRAIPAVRLAGLEPVQERGSGELEFTPVRRLFSRPLVRVTHPWDC